MGDPPQAGQSPIDPAEGALEGVEQAVASGREQLEQARERSLAMANSDAERAAINARFDEQSAQFGAFADRIVGAIETGNEKVLESLAGIAAGLTPNLGGQGDTDDDDDFGIVSIEEVLDDAADAATDGAAAVAGAVGAAADAAVEAADKAPERGHRLYRKLWGNG